MHFECPLWVNSGSPAQRHIMPAIGSELALGYPPSCATSRAARAAGSNVSLAEFGLSRQAKYRALEALERAGLIKVHRSGKRSISVTLLCAAGETPEAILNRKQEVNVVKR